MKNEWVKKLLFPRRCVFCGCLLKEGEEPLCAACVEEFEKLRVLRPGERNAFIDGGVSVAQYDGVVRRGMHRFKFQGKRRAAAMMARGMAEALKNQPWDFDVITWVPVHYSTLWKRGYDQAKELALGVAAETDKPCFALLKKIRKTKPMYRLTAAQRRANVLGAFRARCRQGELQGLRVLVVDDTFTTGATVEECARMLKMAGAEKILYATFAKTVKRA